MKHIPVHHINEDDNYDDSINTSSNEDSDFDRRWVERFGEPQIRVMTVDEFDALWQEMMDFE